MSIHRFSFACLLVGATFAFGDENAAPSSAPVGRYELKNRSTIASRDANRPPFWPIGWVKRGPAVEKAPVVSRVTFDEKSFVVSSILIGNPSLAVIIGRSYMEGDFLRFPRGTEAIRIRVQRILDGGVQLQADNQVFLAKLQRPELQAKKFDDLLPDDR